MASNDDSDLAEDPLIEIKLHEVIRKSKIIDRIGSISIKCSACGKQLDPLSDNLKSHIQLKVLICEECSDFYSSGEFSQDEGGNKYCQWCGNGGKLFGCDFCTKSFCYSCIYRNFGHTEVEEIKDMDWKCYCCEPSKLKPKIAFCDMILDYSKEQRQFKKNTAYSNSVVINYELEYKNFIDNFFETSETLCLKFQHQISALKIKRSTKKKSDKYIFLKLFTATESFKNEMKVMTKKCHEFSYALDLYQRLQNNSSVSHEQKPEVITNSKSNLLVENSLEKHLDNVLSEVENSTRLLDETETESHDKNNLLCISKIQIARCYSVEDKVQSALYTKENDPNFNDSPIKCGRGSDLIVLAENTSDADHSDNNDESISICNTAEDWALECTIESQPLPTLKDSPILGDNHTKDTHLVTIAENISGKEYSDSEYNAISFCNTAKDSDLECTDESKGLERIKPECFASMIKSVMSTESEYSSDSSGHPLKSENLNLNSSNKDQLENKFVRKKIAHEDHPYEKSYNILHVSTNNSHSNENTADNRNGKERKKSTGMRIRLNCINSSSDSESDLKYVITKRKFYKKKVRGNTLPKSKTMEELLKCPKLKMEPYVLIEKLYITMPLTDLSTSLPTHEPGINLNSSVHASVENSKEADKTCLPRAQQGPESTVGETSEFEEQTTKHATVKNNESKLSKTQKNGESLDEIEKNHSASSSAFHSLSSEDHENEEDITTVTQKEDFNELDKKSLLEKTKSSDSSSSDELLPKLKMIVVRKGSDSSSSGEYPPQKIIKNKEVLYESQNAFDDDEKKKGDKKETKRIVRKRRGKNISYYEDSNSDEKRKISKLKRQRKKAVFDSSHEFDINQSNSDIELIWTHKKPPGKGKRGRTPGSGRKPIRKVISDKKLTDETKEAQASELERKIRVQNLQKLDNPIQDKCEDST